MTTVDAEVAQWLRVYAEPRGLNETKLQVIRRVARRLGWKYGRTKALWYQEATPRAEEYRQLRTVMDERYDTARARLDALEQTLAGDRQKLRRDADHAFRAALGRLRGGAA